MYSPEEKEAWKNRMRDLCAKIKEMPKAKKEALAAELGTCTAEGHKLSVRNTCLLWMQAGRALVTVGGKRQWERIGRKVFDDADPIGSIYAPCKPTKDPEDPEGVEVGSGRMRFRLVSMFDLDQTEPA